MAQPGGTYNLLIQDNNGTPQYIKLAKTQSPHGTKIIKTDGKGVRTLITTHKPGTAGLAQVVNSSGTIIQSPQVVRTVTIPGKPGRHFLTIPVQSPMMNVNIKPKGSPSIITTSSPIINNAPSKGHIASILDSESRKRHEGDMYVPESTGVPGKRRKTEKCGKGLRHFSMKVCEKVRRKGLTSYNEVADELVAEFTDPKHIPNSIDQYDQKNIRRRVYDALNVLMAMNIISKEKKEIRWIGLPTTSAQESVSLLSEKKLITERIQSKTQRLNELLIQQISYKNLIQRNFEIEKIRGPPAQNAAIQLPFIVVNSDKKTIIDCSITNDKTEYLFVFNDKFEIKDDFAILKQIGLSFGLEKGAEISESDLEKIKSFVPKVMEKYVSKMALEKTGAANRLEQKVEEEETSLDYDPFDDGSILESKDAAGPSNDFSTIVEDPDSNIDDTSDESNISTDVDIN